MRLILFPCFLLITTFSFAQQDRRPAEGRRPAPQNPEYHDASSLSVYSETGEQFFLVLNGINQNSEPVSRIRVDGLPQYGNDIQILFADRQTPEIRRRINIADPVDGKEVNMVLKIVRNREGFAMLKFQKCVEVDRHYVPEQGEYVMSYGVQMQPANNTSSYYSSTPPPPAGPVAMGPGRFNDVKQSINNASFEDTKLSTAKTILADNYVTTDQVMEICRLFSFENSKVNFAKFAYSRTVDQDNYYRVFNVFDFDSDKQELNNFISRGGR